MTEYIHNVTDRRNGSIIGSWEVAPFEFDSLGPQDIGRTVIYRDHGRAEAGTLTTWRSGQGCVVFARYSSGDTAAGATPDRLVWGVRTIPLEEMLPGIPQQKAPSDD